jgi:hypothetical protein
MQRDKNGYFRGAKPKTNSDGVKYHKQELIADSG